MKDAVEAVEEAFVELQNGTAQMPLRTSITFPEVDGWVGIMPAWLKRMGAFSTKIVTVFYRNREKNLPTIMASVILNDPETGEPLALMDGTYITAMRTGAVCGVATKYLARKDARIAGIFGAGVQARGQLMALCEVRTVEKAYVYDIIEEASKKYALEMSERLGIPIEPCRTPEKVLQESDIISCATTARKPFFEGALVNPGTHVNLIGSFRPDEREVDGVLVKRSRIVVDKLSEALEEAGDLIIPMKQGIITVEDIHAELGELATGTKQGRTSDTEITLFKSVGLGIQDCAVAWRAYNRAKEIGLSIEISLLR